MARRKSSERTGNKSTFSLRFLEDRNVVPSLRDFGQNRGLKGPNISQETFPSLSADAYPIRALLQADGVDQQRKQSRKTPH
jgi:hypothetical protein